MTAYRPTWSPGRKNAFLAFQAAEQHYTSLDERMRQVVILTVSAESREIAPDLHAEAEKTFDPKSLVDLIALVGIYGLVCGLLNGFAIPAPSTPA